MLFVNLLGTLRNYRGYRGFHLFVRRATIAAFYLMKNNLITFQCTEQRYPSHIAVPYHLHIIRVEVQKNSLGQNSTVPKMLNFICV